MQPIDRLVLMALIIGFFESLVLKKLYYFSK